MQIASGWAKGLKLATPSGEATRPTSAKVRAAIANMLAPHLEGALLLDLFAGSGALGIEALSRGCRGAVFVESAAAALACLKQNVAELERRAAKQGLKVEPLTIIARDAVAAMPRIAAVGGFDIITMDPPYARAIEFVERLAPQLAPLAAPDAIFVIETAAADLPKLVELERAGSLGWELEREKAYGDTAVTTWGLPRRDTIEPRGLAPADGGDGDAGD
jgi:16S rRNA (guanine(966)-N(2))-methyltransferase RsmD